MIFPCGNIDLVSMANHDILWKVYIDTYNFQCIAGFAIDTRYEFPNGKIVIVID